MALQEYCKFQCSHVIFIKGSKGRCHFLLFILIMVFHGYYIWILSRKYLPEKILLHSGYFCLYKAMKKLYVLSVQEVGKSPNLYWKPYQRLQRNAIILRFNTPLQIWEKGISKLNNQGVTLNRSRSSVSPTYL